MKIFAISFMVLGLIFLSFELEFGVLAVAAGLVLYALDGVVENARASWPGRPGVSPSQERSLRFAGWCGVLAALGGVVVGFYQTRWGTLPPGECLAAALPLYLALAAAVIMVRKDDSFPLRIAGLPVKWAGSIGVTRGRLLIVFGLYGALVGMVVVTGNLFPSLAPFAVVAGAASLGLASGVAINVAEAVRWPEVGPESSELFN